MEAVEQKQQKLLQQATKGSAGQTCTTGATDPTTVSSFTHQSSRHQQLREGRGRQEGPRTTLEEWFVNDNLVEFFLSRKHDSEKQEREADTAEESKEKL